MNVTGVVSNKMKFNRARKLTEGRRFCQHQHELQGSVISIYWHALDIVIVIYAVRQFYLPFPTSNS